MPAGWKRRIAEGESKMEFILSPEGIQYRSCSGKYDKQHCQRYGLLLNSTDVKISKIIALEVNL